MKRLKFHGSLGVFGEKRGEIREYKDADADMLLDQFPVQYELIEEIKAKPKNSVEKRNNKKAQPKSKK